MALTTILGANGTIASLLLPILQSHNEKIRLVSRNPKPVPGVETMAADALKPEQVLKAIEGSAIVYMVIGLAYNSEIWKRDWPVIMRNVVNACKTTGAKLVYFDNVYMYGRVEGPMTEETPYKPISEKGEARAEAAKILLQEMEAGTIKAVIARASDFYGPNTVDKSNVSVMVFGNMRKGKKAQWCINADVPHTFTYTPDAAQGLYILATHEEAYGQIWHLPNASPALTGKEFVSLVAKYMNGSDKVQVLGKWILKMVGWFVPIVKESYEMNYQNEFSFQVDSTKFEKAFNFKPTSYEEGIKATAEWFLKNQ